MKGAVVALLAFIVTVNGYHESDLHDEYAASFNSLVSSDTYEEIWEIAGVSGMNKPDKCKGDIDDFPFAAEDVVLTFCVYPFYSPPYYHFSVDAKKSSRGDDFTPALNNLLEVLIEAWQDIAIEAGGSFTADFYMVDTNGDDYQYFTTALNALVDGHCDLVIMDHFITDSRTKELSNAGAGFLCPWASAKNGFYCYDQDDPEDLDDLITEGNTWCLVPGSTNHDIVVKKYGDEDNVRDFQSFSDAYEEFSNGEEEGDCNCIGWDDITLRFVQSVAEAENGCDEPREDAKRGQAVNIPCGLETVSQGSYDVAGFALSDSHPSSAASLSSFLSYFF